MDKNNWPEGYKVCNTCDLLKSLSEFNANKLGVRGCAAMCKVCRSIMNKKLYNAATDAERLYKAAKSRALSRNILFTISVSDIHVPSHCPALGIPLVRGEGKATDNSPSLDRLDPEQGYIPDNIIVISNKANRIKTNASVDEIEKVLLWLKGQ